MTARTRRSALARSDRGSVLLLTMGFVVIIVMAIGVIVDASAVFLQRRALASLADGAALAGAQSVDLDAYYRSGAQAALRPTASQVRADVLTYLDRAGRSAAGIDVEHIGVDAGEVVVRLRATARAPFTGWLRVDFPVRAEAGARLMLR